MSGQNREIYSFDGFELDAANRQLRHGGEVLLLPPKTFDVLVALVENNGRLVGKDEILAHVWGDQIVEESNLTVHISQIRKALGETKSNPRFIETVSGYGYRFVGDVSNLQDEDLIIETETLSRITLEKVVSDAEISEIEKRRMGEGEKILALQNVPAAPRLLVPGSPQIMVGAFIILSIIAGIFWLSNRTQNNGAIVPAVLAEKQTQIKRLTSKGIVNLAVLSPDGKFFAYTLGERGSYQSSLWLGQTNGNSVMQMRPADNLVLFPRSFSADGNSLYYTVSEPRDFNNGTLYKMPVLGGVPQKLLSGISVYVVLSPDEKQVVFVRRNLEKKTEALVIVNLDGTGEWEIVSHPMSEQYFLSFSLSWSADGALVAFGAKNGAGKSYEIFTANTASGEVKQITSLEWIGIFRVAWLPDGSGLVLVGRDKHSFAANQLWQIDYESGKAQKITRDLQHYGATLSLSADSNLLVALQTIQESHIWIAPAENLAAARQITFGSSGHEGWFGLDWAPNGKIVFVARVDQSLTLWTMEADGGRPEQITSAGFLDEKPSATSDGKYIVFQSNRSGSTEIWRINSDGSDLRQLTFDGKNSVPHSTPDGKAIVYMHAADGANPARLISIDGGEARQITDAECYNPRVSPDGNFIACGYVDDGKTKLAILPITGGTPLKLLDIPPTYNFDGSIRWTRDGKSVTYRDWMNGIWSQSVDGGAPKRLAGVPAEKLYHYEWSPDGKQFAFTRGRVMRDVVLISDFR